MNMTLLGHVVLGAGIGGVAGFWYYRLVGCSSGMCPLTSTAWRSTLYGVVMGILVAWK